MASVGITYEQVAAAADSLVGEGTVPTIRAVRDRLGGTGSPITIHRHLTVWREAHPVPPAAAREPSVALNETFNAEVERHIAQERGLLNGLLAQAKVEVDDLSAAGEALGNLMNPQELLIHAAAAAHIEWTQATDAGLHEKSGSLWNPLHDDGAALRLAVRLGMTINPPNLELENVSVNWRRPWWCNGTLFEPIAAPEYDYLAATRRAIVRAAALLGHAPRGVV